MKTKFYLLLFLLTGLTAQAQTSNLTTLLQQGLFEEQANRNLNAAISNYQTIAAQFDKDRELAATAVFRIGECYRMQGKTNDAVTQYQRILRDFSDQAPLATLSRQNLAGLGSVASTTSAAPPLTDGARQEQEDLLNQELALVEQQLVALQTQVKLGTLPTSSLLSTQQKVIEIKLQLAQLRGGQPGSAQTSAPTDEEEHEIRRIQELIQNSPDLINSGDLPLINAAKNGWLRVATYLLDHGAEVNGSQRGMTALSAAAIAGNRAMMELLLNRGADVNAGVPLCQAAMKGFQAVVEVLLAHKADVNVSTSEGTPLQMAAQNLHPKIIQMLLTAGANPNLENKKGFTALSLAARSPEIVKLLLDAKADANGGKIDVPLIAAIDAHDTASAELLLQAGANPNLKSAIDGAITENLLVGRGGFGGLRTSSITPMFLAVETKQLPIVNLLLKFKADPNDSQTEGHPVLFSALSETNILESLLVGGAKVEVKQDEAHEQTPLIAAVLQNNSGAVETLLKHGANPNARAKDIITPLDVAARVLADTNIFELLLADKADPNVRGYLGKTPLELLHEGNGSRDAATVRKALELADLLRRHGALDNPPAWDSITISRPSSHFSHEVFEKDANDWNHFTLLETILNYYSTYELLRSGFEAQIAARQGIPENTAIPFPDLAHVTIVRLGHGAKASEHISVNLLNSTNGIDCSKDVPLEFGDLVELPEREHSLAETAIFLTASQRQAITDCVKGTVTLIVRDQKLELPVWMSTLQGVLSQSEVRKILTSSSALSVVKVLRHDAKTSKNHEWIIDCSIPAPPNPPPPLWLRNGDIISVPEIVGQ